MASNKFHYGLELRYLGHVTAKLRQVDLHTGNDPDEGLVLFDSTKFAASPSFKVETAFASQFEGVLDFVNKAYYVRRHSSHLRWWLVIRQPSRSSRWWRSNRTFE